MHLLRYLYSGGTTTLAVTTNQEMPVTDA